MLNLDYTYDLINSIEPMNLTENSVNIKNKYYERTKLNDFELLINFKMDIFAWKFYRDKFDHQRLIKLSNLQSKILKEYYDKNIHK